MIDIFVGLFILWMDSLVNKNNQKKKEELLVLFDLTPDHGREEVEDLDF